CWNSIPVTGTPNSFSGSPTGKFLSIKPLASTAPALISTLQVGPAGKRAGSNPTTSTCKSGGRENLASPSNWKLPGTLGSSPPTTTRLVLKMGPPALTIGANNEV